MYITAVPIIKLFAWGEGDSGGHVQRETTSRGPCGLVCPSRTSERGGEGDSVKEGREKKGSARGSVHWGCYYATALDIEVDPQRRRFGRRESDFALQRLVECLWSILCETMHKCFPRHACRTAQSSQRSIGGCKILAVRKR